MNKRKQWHQYLVTAAFVMLGVLFGVIMVSYAENTAKEGTTLADELWTLALLFVGMYISIFLQTIIHEAGHLAFGLLTGYRFTSFRVGSLMLLRQEGKLVLRWMHLAGTGGQCLMAPPEMVDGKMPYVLYHLGGSILNLAASLIFILLFLLVPDGSVLDVLLLVMTLMGIALALINGIPMDLGTVDNDGRNALSLGKDPQALKAFWIQMKANEMTAAGVRIKDMPEAWFEPLPDGGLHNSMTAGLAVFACSRLMDAHRFTEAEEKIRHLLGSQSAIAGIHRDLLVCDLMYCEMIHCNRREIVEDMLTKQQKKFMRSMHSFLSVIRTEYVYALQVERDQKEADRIRNLFEKRAGTYPYTADIESERELMDIAHRRSMGEMNVEV